MPANALILQALQLESDAAGVTLGVANAVILAQLPAVS
jgi:hypothetical protein